MNLLKRRAGSGTRMVDRGVFSSVVMVVVVLLFLPYVVQMKYLGPKLSHLAVDDVTGTVYIGGEYPIVNVFCRIRDISAVVSDRFLTT